jgi:hypothetical protein
MGDGEAASAGKNPEAPEVSTGFFLSASFPVCKPEYWALKARVNSPGSGNSLSGIPSLLFASTHLSRRWRARSPIFLIFARIFWRSIYDS